MKKILIVGAFIVAICLSFLAGNYCSNREQEEHRAQECQGQIVFAIDKLEDLKVQYDADTMEAVISNIYAAYNYADDGALASALHELWNALIFDGENIAEKEDALIQALGEVNAEEIKGLAISMRTTSQTS